MKKIVPICQTTYVFKSEDDYLEWQEQEDNKNTIYALATLNDFFGDIREEHLLNFLDQGKIISLDNPDTPSEEYLAEHVFKGNHANWGVLPQYEKEVMKFLCKIEYPEGD